MRLLNILLAVVSVAFFVSAPASAQRVDPEGNAGWRHIEIQVINLNPAVRKVIQDCNRRGSCYWKKLFDASRTPGSGITAYTGGGNVTVAIQYINAAVDVTSSKLLTSGDIYTGPALVRLDGNVAWVNVPILHASRGGKGTGIVAMPEAFFSGKQSLVCLRSEDIPIEQSATITKGQFVGQSDVECDEYYTDGKTRFGKYFEGNPRNKGYMFTFFRQTGQ